MPSTFFGLNTVQKVKLKKSFRTLPHHFKSAQRIHSRENDTETPEA